MQNNPTMYSNGQVRRIVTGHDAQGRAVVSSDTMAPNVIAHPHRPGYFSTQLWTTFSTPAIVGNEPDPTAIGKLPLAPPACGSVARIVDFPPEPASVNALDGEQARAAFEAIGGHSASTFDANARHPFMHRTESIDYGIVLSGEIHLVLDDSEVLVRTGDVVVQRGTNHAWSNRSGAHCQVLFVLIDGKFGPDCARID